MSGFDDLDPSLFSEEVPTERSGCGLLSAAVILTVLAIGLAGAFYLLPGPGALLARFADTVAGEPRGEGLTVLVKERQRDGPVDRDINLPDPILDTPAAHGFAIHLGAANSFAELSRRYAEIVAINAELGLDHLEPRATLNEASQGLEARLMVGPYESLAEAQAACANMALPAQIRCTAGRFSGVAIARQ